MAGGGFIVGGLLSGLGKGLEVQAAQNREDALERLRAARQIDTENRGEVRQIAKEDRDEVRTIASDERAYGAKKSLLETAGEIKQRENETDFDYKVRLEKIRQQGDQTLETLKAKNEASLAAFRSKLDTSRDAASIKLKADIDRAEAAGTLDSVEVDKEGNYVIFFKDGRQQKTDIGAKPTAAMNEAEEERSREERRAARNRGGASPAKPTNKPAGQKAGDIPLLKSDAEADRFTSDPKNKGKLFIGPDGKQYRA